MGIVDAIMGRGGWTDEDKESPLSLEVRIGRSKFSSELPEGTSLANTYILSPTIHFGLISRSTRINLWHLQPLHDE